MDCGQEQLIASPRGLNAAAAAKGLRQSMAPTCHCACKARLQQVLPLLARVPPLRWAFSPSHCLSMPGSCRPSFGLRLRLRPMRLLLPRTRSTVLLRLLSL